MDSYRKPPRVNRYWKRPKPKVYDCNVRDAERFYQESYKTYLTSKEEAAARSTRARSYDNTIQTEFYPHLVAGNTSRRDTAARTSLDLKPLPSTLSDSTRARLEAELTTNASQSDHSFSARAGGLPAYEPVKDVATLDERLSRLKKLREELGLPSDVQTKAGGASSHSLRSESVGRSATGAGSGSDLDLYKSERTTRTRVERTPEDSGSYSVRSERTAKVNGTVGSSEDYKYRSERNTEDLGGGSSYNKYKSDSTTSDYKYRSDRNTDDQGGSSTYKYRSDRTNDDQGGSSRYKFKSDLQTDDYTVGGGRSRDQSQRNVSPPKLERKRDDFSYSSSAATEKADRFSSSAGASSRKAEKNLEAEVDDDTLATMMKKMPSSQEILERISKMELDD